MRGDADNVEVYGVIVGGEEGGELLRSDGFVALQVCLCLMARSALVCLRGSRSRFEGLCEESLELPAKVVNSEASL